MSPNDADGMANSADPDQTAPLGAVWSGSALFAQAYLPENLGSLRYDMNLCVGFFFFLKTGLLFYSHKLQEIGNCTSSHTMSCELSLFFSEVPWNEP